MEKFKTKISKITTRRKWTNIVQKKNKKTNSSFGCLLLRHWIIFVNVKQTQFPFVLLFFVASSFFFKIDVTVSVVRFHNYYESIYWVRESQLLSWFFLVLCEQKRKNNRTSKFPTFCRFIWTKIGRKFIFFYYLGAHQILFCAKSIRPHNITWFIFILNNIWIAYALAVYT